MAVLEVEALVRAAIDEHARSGVAFDILDVQRPIIAKHGALIEDRAALARTVERLCECDDRLVGYDVFAQLRQYVAKAKARPGQLALARSQQKWRDEERKRAANAAIWADAAAVRAEASKHWMPDES